MSLPGKDLSVNLISEIDLGRCDTRLFGLSKAKKNIRISAEYKSVLGR